MAFRWAAFSFVGLFAWSAGAVERVDFRGIDISPLLEVIRPQIAILTRPVTVYNWSQIQNPELDDARLYAQSRAAAELFWNRYGTSRDSDDFGYGFYAATDPVITARYGGDEGRWLLQEIQLPRGFKTIDLGTRSNGYERLSKEARAVAQEFSCPARMTIADFFRYGASMNPTPCQQLGRMIFQDYFKIDGFFYGYMTSGFAACELDEMRAISGRALVVLNSSWMRPELFNYYSPTTTKRFESRVRIQTLFLQAQDRSADYPAEASEANREFMQSHGSSEKLRLYIPCGDERCFVHGYWKLKEARLRSFPRKKNEELLTSQLNYGRGLLWADLEGVPRASTDEWLRQNNYGCDGQRVLAPAP